MCIGLIIILVLRFRITDGVLLSLFVPPFVLRNAESKTTIACHVKIGVHLQ